MKKPLLSTKNKLSTVAASLALPTGAVLLAATMGSLTSAVAKPAVIEAFNPNTFTVSAYQFTPELLSAGVSEGLHKVSSHGQSVQSKKGWVKLPLSQNPLALKRIETLLAEKNPLVDHQQALSFVQSSLKIQQTKPIKARSAKLDASTRKLIHRAADEYGLPRSLFIALIEQESQFKPNAVSKANAIGLGQVLPSTALWLTGKGAGPHHPTAIEHMAARLKKPEFNLALSARYFSYLLKIHAYDVDLALAAYNAGPGVVAKFKGVPPYAETRRYVSRVKSKTMRHFRSTLSQSAGVHTRSTPISLTQAQTVAMN